VHGPGGDLVPVALASPDLAGVHFTGSTAVFRSIWSQTGENIAAYRNFPRLVGETGGKDFIVAHRSADVDALGTAIVRGSFEYQGQKCSAASRVFVPDNLWPELRERLGSEVATIPVGDVADFRNFMGAVINERSFRRQAEAIEEARSRPGHSVLVGGGTDSSRGWFVQPTVVLTEDSGSRLLRDELFGPVVTVFVYPEGEYEPTLDVVDRSVPFGLTGAVFAEDRGAVATAQERLRYAAGNFYINDKPTGAVVGQQPFGGARASGTDDKAGSMWNLARWVSPRTIKETFVPARAYRYPYMETDRP
jgi:1-pyrroline-5-carboxylate dehydrogenase